MTDAKVAGLLFAVAFLVRLVAYLGTFIFGADGGQFLFMADWFCDGRFHEALSVTYHPLYSFLVAGVRGLFPSTEEAGFWVSMVFGSGASVPLFLVTRSIFGRPVGFMTALIYAFHPHAVLLQADVMTEGTFLFFLFWSIWLVWSVIENPSLERSLLAGFSAACTYLTRPEGVLAAVLVLFWPVAMMVAGRRNRVVARLGGVAAGAAAVLLAAGPFLFWVHSVTGRWTFSAKESVAAAEQALPSSDGAFPVDGDALEGRYAKMGRSILRMTYIGAPFYLIGIFSMRRISRGAVLFYLSFPLGYLGGVAWTLQKLPYLSYRYVIPAMILLTVFEALGAFRVMRFLARRWPEHRWVLASQALLALLTVGISVRVFGAHRYDEQGIRDAATWIRSQRIPEPRICTTVDKIAYLAGGSLPIFYEADWEAFLRQAQGRPANFYVYTDKDCKKGWPPYLDRLADRWPEAAVFHADGRPLSHTVYVLTATRKEIR